MTRLNLVRSDGSPGAVSMKLVVAACDMLTPDGFCGLGALGTSDERSSVSVCVSHVGKSKPAWISWKLRLAS